MKKSIKSIIVLVSISLVISLALAVTNYVTAPIIEKNESEAANKNLLVVLPDGGKFEKMDTSAYTLPSAVSEVYKASNGGYVFRLLTTGYQPGFSIMCGISSDGKVVGSTVISSAETPNIGGVAADKVAVAIVGKNTSDIDGVDTVAGATKTTSAYRAAIKDALNAAIILGGGSVDLRTEEEILNDNLSAVLPTAEGKFTKLLIAEVIEGIDAIYTADNGAGTVCVIGEQFVATNANGDVIGEVDEALAAKVSEQTKKVLATTMEDITLGDYEGLPSALVSAKVTESGNYVLELKAAGFGINGDQWYKPSGEYIHIKVSMTKDGKIIDCLTVSQAESDGIGSACADKDFYSQFIGKTQDNYSDIDSISGATLTTNGYKTAILRAFESVAIFEGGKGE